MSSRETSQSLQATEACDNEQALTKPFSHPPEQPLCAKDATLQPPLQDILHALPALIQTATTPSDPAETTQVPLYCGRTKIFMTDSMVNWLGCEIIGTSCKCRPSLGQGQERPRTSMDSSSLS